MPVVKDYLWVGCGAALGAVARYLLALLLGPSVWVIVTINIIGCYLMGRTRPGLFWGTGFLGGFTTFSAFELSLFAEDRLIVLALTVLGCLGAWQLGNAAYRRVSP
ncbi:fluoride efflux transporter family protein [Corynebacterium sp. H128]|uniref:fluoride efflux transporter family protein n=1 Tax=unclassified Corynebacterium TaxID=2624378 RepID=UPI0030981DE1